MVQLPPAGAIRKEALWHYSLVACPDNRITEQIAEEGQEFQTAFAHAHCLETMPHIMVASFLAREQMEEILSRWIQNICNLHSAFDVSLNNYSGIPPHTIYLRVQEITAFQKLSNALKMLDGFIQSNDCPPMFLPSRPYMSLASGLPEHVYEKAARVYAHKNFFGSFRVEKLVLLRSDACMKKTVIHTFSLPSPFTIRE